MGKEYMGLIFWKNIRKQMQLRFGYKDEEIKRQGE